MHSISAALTNDFLTLHFRKQMSLVHRQLPSSPISFRRMPSLCSGHCASFQWNLLVTGHQIPSKKKINPELYPIQNAYYQNEKTKSNPYWHLCFNYPCAVASLENSNSGQCAEGAWKLPMFLSFTEALSDCWKDLPTETAVRICKLEWGRARGWNCSLSPHWSWMHKMAKRKHFSSLPLLSPAPPHPTNAAVLHIDATILETVPSQGQKQLQQWRGTQKSYTYCL